MTLVYESFRYLNAIYARSFEDENVLPKYYDDMISILLPLLELLPEMINASGNKFEIYVRNSSYPIVYGGSSCEGFMRNVDDNVTYVGSTCYYNRMNKSAGVRINSHSNNISMMFDVMANLHEICHVIQHIKENLIFRIKDFGETFDFHYETHAQVFSLMMYLNYYVDIIYDTNTNEIDKDVINSILKPNWKNIVEHNHEISCFKGILSRLGKCDYFDVNTLGIVILNTYHNTTLSKEYVLDIVTIRNIIQIVKDLPKELNVETIDLIYEMSKEIASKNNNECKAPWLEIIYYVNFIQEYML